MAATAAKKPRRRARPVWLRVQQLVNPDTGEAVAAFVPAHPMDNDECRRRKYARGLVLRAELKQRRNPKFYRLAHGMAKLVAQNCDGFEAQCASEDWHGALKKLQQDSGVACELVEYDIPDVGKLTRREPLSLNFEDMDEAEFRKVFGGIVAYVCRELWPDMDPRAVEEMSMNMVGREASAE